jgi:hypothetical protein
MDPPAPPPSQGAFCICRGWPAGIIEELEAEPLSLADREEEEAKVEWDEDDDEDPIMRLALGGAPAADMAAIIMDTGTPGSESERAGPPGEANAAGCWKCCCMG